MSAATGARPNILLFFTDDQRFDTIAALGNPDIHTPHLDALAAKGTAFTRAFIPGGTVGAVCMPSRAMLLTGRTLFHLEEAGHHVPESHLLLGEFLRAQGYRTFGTGKWHNGSDAYARSFTDGAEIFFGGMEDHWNVPACHFDPSGHYSAELPVCADPYNGKQVRVRPGDHVTPGKHSSALFADAAIAFLANHTENHGHAGRHPQDAPFFLYVALMAPHDPRIMPADYRRMYDASQLKLPANFMPTHPFDNGALDIRDERLAAFPRQPAEIREHLADYYAMITHLDAQLGRVLAALDATGQADNTIIVFAGDNGLALGQHGLMGKQNLYDHSVRVPLIMAGPGIPANQRRDSMVYLLDIYPTLCQLIGLTPPSSVEGRSLVATLHDSTVRVRNSLYLAYAGYQRGICTDQHKLIRYHVDGNTTTQLFDRQADPWEVNNLAGRPETASIQAELAAQLLHLRDEWDDLTTTWGQAFWAVAPA